MTWLNAILIAAGAWRIAHLLVYESGPFHVIDQLRERLGANAISESPPFWAQLFGCMLCMTFWTNAVLFGIWEAGVIEPIWFIGIWGLATTLSKIIDR